MFRDGSLRHGHPASQRLPVAPCGRLRLSPRLSRGNPNRTSQQGICPSTPAALPRRPPRSASRRHHAGLRVCPLRVERSFSFPLVRDGAGSNASVSVADPEGGPVALFMAQPKTRRLQDSARVMALAATPERDSRTVKQVTFLLHGVNTNGALWCPFLHRVPRRPGTCVQPVTAFGALRAATRAMQRSRPGAGHGPTHAATPHRGTGCVTPRLWGVTQPAAPVTTRIFVAIRR